MDPGVAFPAGQPGRPDEKPHWPTGYAWYPDRFGVKDAFRMGNYALLANLGGNIALEFFYSGPHALMSRLHLNNPHGSTTQGQN